MPMTQMIYLYMPTYKNGRIQSFVAFAYIRGLAL